MSEKPSKTSLQNTGLSLKNIEQYFNLNSNPSIKKYLRVIGDYHKKYNEDLVYSSHSQQSTNYLLTEFLKYNTIKD